MSHSEADKQLALHGGKKAVPQIEAEEEPKVGVEEFMALAERFGFSDEALARIRSAVAEEDMGAGPYLSSYRTSPRHEPSRTALESLARETFGVEHALAVSSGTAALHSAFVAAGVGPGTEVICPAIGFYATAAEVVHAKGIPVFCDVDTSMGMDPGKIEDLITPRTVALAPTHVMGSVCDMGAIVEVARKHDLKVIEDCAQSCGGKFDGQYVGTFGDLGCFSISVYKIIGGGEGGLVLTDDERLYNRAQQLAECGGLWRPDRFAPPRYEGELFCGTNYRISDLEAALDVVQLGRMPETVRQYRQAKQRILTQLKRYREIEPQKLNDAQGEVGYLIRFYPETYELGHRVVEALNAEGIGCGMKGEGGKPDWHLSADMLPITLKSGATEEGCPYTCPIYLERGGSAEYRKGDCPVAEDLFHRVVSIRVNPWYSEADCDAIAQGMNKVFGALCTEDPEAVAWL
ncbi:MAG: DegT/DnrJ/EryC1/StrS family aminotransferase [Candidatus Latescibacteria bacterium]|nr:DegT/DnrJ/EryC1/StrS family aminotransferase [Candidatus Latescibacterota bacterium]